jgi:hypothetical protein
MDQSTVSARPPQVNPMSDSASWQPYQGGSTLGMMGSQGGTITWDEEYGASEKWEAG